MSGELPADLTVPALAAAKAVARVPGPEALPGGSLWEPKWDGFRMAAIVTDTVTLRSRQGKDLTRYFPDLAAAFAGQVPPGCVIDGEALIWSDDRLDFTTLQARMTTGRKAFPAFVRAHPASFAAFDLLAAAGNDTRHLALANRRALLEELAAGWAPPLNLSPATADHATALEWFEEMPPATGIEGLVVKGAGQAYEGGVRQWLKVKHRDTLDVVCAAVLGRRDAPAAVVAGLPLFGRLWIVGTTSPLGKAASRALAMHLHQPRPDHPWPEEVAPGVIDHFTSRKEPVRLTRVEPIVVEVSADVAWSGRAFRHPLRYLRARPELNPAAVAVPEHLARG